MGTWNMIVEMLEYIVVIVDRSRTNTSDHDGSFPNFNQSSIKWISNFALTCIK